MLKTTRKGFIGTTFDKPGDFIGVNGDKYWIKSVDYNTGLIVIDDKAGTLVELKISELKCSFGLSYYVTTK